MKILSLIFFYGYVGFLFVFGALGVFTARLGPPILFMLSPRACPRKPRPACRPIPFLPGH